MNASLPCRYLPPLLRSLSSKWHLKVSKLGVNKQKSRQQKKIDLHTKNVLWMENNHMVLKSNLFARLSICNASSVNGIRTILYSNFYFYFYWIFSVCFFFRFKIRISPLIFSALGDAPHCILQLAVMQNRVASKQLNKQHEKTHFTSKMCTTHALVIDLKLPCNGERDIQRRSRAKNNLYSIIIIEFVRRIPQNDRRTWKKKSEKKIKKIWLIWINCCR